MSRYSKEATCVLKTKMEGINDCCGSFAPCRYKNLSTNSKCQRKIMFQSIWGPLSLKSTPNDYLSSGKMKCRNAPGFKNESRQLPNLCQKQSIRRRYSVEMNRLCLVALLALFSITNGGFGVACCQQSIDSLNSGVTSDSFDNSLHVADSQLSTDNTNINQASSASSSGINIIETDNINGGEINGATPFGSGGSTSNRNEKQPGLLCPDIYPVSTFKNIPIILFTFAGNRSMMFA